MSILISFVLSLICRNSFRHVVLDVVEVNLVFVLVEAVRAEIFCHLRGREVGICHNHTTAGNNLCIRAYIFDLILFCFLVKYQSTQILTCASVRVIKLPVEGVNAYGVRHYHHVMSIGLHVLRSFSVPADDTAGITFAGGKLQMRICFKVFLCDGEAIYFPLFLSCRCLQKSKCLLLCLHP